MHILHHCHHPLSRKPPLSTQTNVDEPIGGYVGAGDAFVGSLVGAGVGANVGETKAAALGANVNEPTGASASAMH